MVDITASEAMVSDLLFGRFFAGSSWARWKTVIKATFGEPLSTDDDTAQFREIAARDPPKSRARELVAIVGRGGGKDSIASLIATCAAINFDPRASKLRPGETVVVMCLATATAARSTWTLCRYLRVDVRDC